MIIRSLRSIANRYTRNNSMINTCFEEKSPHILFETTGRGQVAISDDFPKCIVLNASFVASPIKSKVNCVRKFYDKTLCNIDLYTSQIQTENFGCASVNVIFENSGYAINNDNEKISFFDKKFDEYQLSISDNILYKKVFLTTQKDIIENTNEEGIILKNKETASRIIYPYGGMYQYGLHPKRIEATVCFITENNTVKIIPLSSIQGINPLKNTKTKSGKWFIGVGPSSSDYADSLYDDIMKGACKCILKHNESEKVFISNALNWYEKTNLVQIKFIQQQEEK